MVGAARQLRPVIRDNRIDLVHTHDLRMHMTWCLAAKAAGVRHIWHQRTADPSRRNALFSGLADRVLTISEHCRRVLPGAMGRRAQIIDNPFDFGAYPSAEAAEKRRRLHAMFDAPADTRVVAFVGAISMQKQPIAFVEAAEALTRVLPFPVVFPMIGKEGDAQEAVERAIAARGLDRIVRAIGYRDPLDPWLDAVDVVVVPAVNEGQGRVVVEAMARGLPVVASASGGHMEVIRDGETGRLVPAGDPVAIDGAVRTLLEAPNDAARLGAAAARSVRRRFDQARHVESVIQVYRDVCAG